MAAQLLDGKALAASIKEKIKLDIGKLKSKPKPKTASSSSMSARSPMLSDSPLLYVSRSGSNHN